jgi:hydroxyethylthiazole kinase-like uncharacterized protein yjeF
VTSSERNEPSRWIIPPIGSDANKYTRGHVVVFGGYPMTGAARLAARTAARSGAGMVTIGTSSSAIDSYLAAVESIMVKPADDVSAWRALIEKANATVVGPGAGIGDITRNIALESLRIGVPSVLDADALTSLIGFVDMLSKTVHGPCVLTPHEGEFARLFDVRGDRDTRATSAAGQSGCVVVLKGHHTVIAAPDGRCVVNDNAPPTLATAGSGDVLAGVTAALMARGMNAFDAACAAVWVHGEAANRAAPGLIADDLPALIAIVLADLLT